MSAEPLQPLASPEPPPGVARKRIAASVWIGFLIGIGLTALLSVWIDLGDALKSVLAIGWGLVAVLAFHVVQMAFSGAAWSASSPWPGGGIRVFVMLRWIREGINNLLPVAQIGGEVVAARLMAQRGQRLSDAGASVTVDLTVETLTQVAFTLLGLGLLATLPHGTDLALWAGLGAALAVAGAIAFVIAQRAGLMRLVERLLMGMADKLSWLEFGTLEGIHDSVHYLYGRRRAFAIACANHMVSWLLGGIEIMLILWLLGTDVGLREGLVIESLGQATKAVGFAIPGALAVQEGGLILVCSAFGIGADVAVALSFVKRVREVLLGLPALAAWHLLESRHRRAKSLALASARGVDP